MSSPPPLLCLPFWPLPVVNNVLDSAPQGSWVWVTVKLVPGESTGFIVVHFQFSPFSVAQASTKQAFLCAFLAVFVCLEEQVGGMVFFRTAICGTFAHFSGFSRLIGVDGAGWGQIIAENMLSADTTVAGHTPASTEEPCVQPEWATQSGHHVECPKVESRLGGHHAPWKAAGP